MTEQADVEVIEAGNFVEAGHCHGWPWVAGTYREQIEAVCAVHLVHQISSDVVFVQDIVVTDIEQKKYQGRGGGQPSAGCLIERGEHSFFEAGCEPGFPLNPMVICTLVGGPV